MITKTFFILCSINLKTVFPVENIPIVVTTWAFPYASNKAWEVLSEGGSAVDAIEQGGTACETMQCDGTVGYGGSPDENGETTLDAMIMDGTTMNVGAVAGLRRVKNAISVARKVLDHTKHSLLIGDLATQFAVEMGFQEESLTTADSKKMWKHWHNDMKCQPNFWVNVVPDPTENCGPYNYVRNTLKFEKLYREIDRYNHDTIGIVAADQNGNVAAGTSTNGAKFKIPGRVGDSPIPGAGAYADSEVGAAAATGDGDIMLRFLPSFVAVEEMRRGASPLQAAQRAVGRVVRSYPQFSGAVVVLSRDGRHAAACHGFASFPYIVRDHNHTYSITYHVSC